MLVSFGFSSGTPPDIALAMLAKKSLFITRPSLASHTATAKLTEEIRSPLFEVIKNGLSITINQIYPLKEALNAHLDLENRKTTGSSIFEI